jgi:hypothetical protein
MNKPIAHICWIEDGEEKSIGVYDQQLLDGLTGELRSENLCYWVCMESMKVDIPRNTS